MAEDSQVVMIYTTWPDTASAETAGRALVAGKLAACVNILPASQSIYEWQGSIETGTEWPMIIKSVAGKADDVAAALREMHPYDVPAIVFLPAAGGDPEFLSWIVAQTAPHDKTGL